jgi:hypothetical protein
MADDDEFFARRFYWGSRLHGGRVTQISEPELDGDISGRRKRSGHAQPKERVTPLR